MCRCCQSCWEDFYWNCFEERFCYDESIANYNPEEDEDYIAAQKSGNALALAAATQNRANNNNHLTVPEPICQQPIRGGHANFNSLKIHEEDFRRETQTNVPMLGPEILSVFANSQIFQDHQPTKLSRINTKTHLAGIHSNGGGGGSASPIKDMVGTSALAAAAAATALTTAAEQERLIRSLEANLNGDETNATKIANDQTKTPTVMWEDLDVSPDKRITFTLTSSDTSPSDSIQTISSKKFYTISEEQSDIDHASQKYHHEKATSMENDISNSEEIILRPRLTSRYPSNLLMQGGAVAATKKRSLRTVKSVPHLNMRTISGDVDIFAIGGSNGGGSQMSISMTPEVPSISFANLPKNYVDTPTIEKYRVSQSLYAIQTANAAARALQEDFSMPRYFRKSGLVSHSIDGLQPSASTSQLSSMGVPNTNATKEPVKRVEIVKSKRLQMIRSNIAPLLIHSVSFKRNRGDESKQLD